MEFIPAVALVALIWKIVDFLKYVARRDVNGAASIAVVWVAAIAVFFLFAQSDWAGELEVGNKLLSDYGWASLVILGLSFGASASALFDFKKALDNTDSAAVPSLLPESGPAVPTRDTPTSVADGH